jgi:hypothetical protein
LASAIDDGLAGRGDHLKPVMLFSILAYHLPPSAEITLTPPEGSYSVLLLESAQPLPLRC